MGTNEGCARALALSLFIVCILHIVVSGYELGWNQDGPSLREACANTFDFEDPTCQGNSTLYWGTGNGTDLSCAHCVCPDGWGGLDCGRCLNVSVCPTITEDGKTLAATNCSSDTLLLTEEEASYSGGKVFSCSCGGGEDLWTDFLCDQQPDTWIQWAVMGGGTEGNESASVTIKEFAGIHARTEETWPDQYKYHYPKIFEGSASSCKVYRNKCLPVEGTDVGDRDCVLFECADTEGVCPPEEYPMCDGFPNCRSPTGQKYVTHRCTAAPQTHKSITIACQEEKVNGSFVCYYQQPEGFAPMSMTCSVGSCLYEGGTPVPPSAPNKKSVPWSMGVQMFILLSLAILLLIVFAVFSVASDSGSATKLPRKFPWRCSKMKQKSSFSEEVLPESNNGNLEKLGDQELGVPLLGADGEALTVNEGSGDGSSAGYDGNVLRGSCRLVDESSARRVGLEDPGDGVGRGSSEQVGAARGDDGGRPQPAVLRWTKLAYFVKGGGLNSDEEEFAVLQGISGFAGPDQGDPRRDSSFPLSSELESSTEISEGSRYHHVTLGERSSERRDAPVNGFSGDIYPCGDATTNVPLSTMTGILGPSGAGKSSLLDVLAGRKRKGEGRATGSISLSFSGHGYGVGVEEIEGDGAEAVRRVSGYVSQEDVLPGTLTCYEHLMFHARLRMPAEFGFIERRARVLWLLEEFGLVRVADSRIGDELERGLSGGERRRLSIAAELVARPALLFLDEPTTGLDAATALRVVTLLKGVASRGTTVICSLHQPRPSVFNQFDRVILLAKGRVAYSGTPGEAEAYFRSIRRPFPPGESTRQPADAMLVLCCREDGRDLPRLFRRSCMYAESIGNRYACGRYPEERFAESKTSGAAVVEGIDDGNVGGLRSSPDCADVAKEEAAAEEQQQDQQLPLQAMRDISSELGAAHGDAGQGDAGGFMGTELVQVRGRSDAARGHMNERKRQNPWRERECGGGKASVPFLVQVEALSRRLLLRAARHPLLLVLHFGGSVAMALCLASVFGGRLEFTLEGAQNRFGALFFILLYLSLLSLTSLPMWREDRRLFLTEAMGGAYGHLGYFTSVALVDVLLIRVLPPLAFAVVAYPLIGLNSAPDNHGCLLWFAGILVLTNVTVALAAMGVGALGLPLELSNLMGGLMVLVLAAFGRFLLNGTRIPWGWRWMSFATPLGYAFEALLINEFTDESSSRPYRIEGSHCSPGLPLIEAQGPQILSTFSFSPSRTTRRFDTVLLGYLALALTASSLIIFFFATRTKPLEIKSSRVRRPGRASGFRRTRSITTRSAGHGSRGDTSKRLESDNDPPLPPSADFDSSHRDLEATVTRPRDEIHPRSNRNDAVAGVRRNGARIGWIGTRRTVTWNLPEDEAPSHGGRDRGMGSDGHSSRRQQRRRRHTDRDAVSQSPPLPLVLSWEGLRYSVPMSRERRLFLSGGDERTTSPTIVTEEAGDTSRAEDLIVLDGISGFAGPSLVEMDEADNGLGEESAVLSGTVTAIMGPSGAGKTSLLNALAGRLKATETRRLRSGGGKGLGLSGKVRINGVEVSAAVVREMSAYVTQEDVLPETLTCHEHLMFHAHLRLPAGTSLELRNARVSEILDVLGLSDVQDSRVGGGLSRGISGGEKRRLSIGTELLTRPALLFLDEPTTGLDSSTALRVMQLVSQVASRGTTVLCSVHQPRPVVVELLDRIILLSRGTVAFAGPPEKAGSYFASIGRPFPPPPGKIPRAGGGKRHEVISSGLEVSPADAMLDVVGEAEALADQHGEGLVVMPEEVLLEQVRAAEASAPPPPAVIIADGNTRSPVDRYPCDESRRTSPPLLTQLSALLRRSALNVARDPCLAGLHVVLTVCVGVVVGTLFYDLNRLNGNTAGVQDRLGVVFLLLLYLSLLCLTSLAAWRKQMSLFLHERASGAYGAVAHLATAATVDAVACRILPPFILAVAVRSLSGLREGSTAGMVGGLVAFNLSLAGVLAACGAASRSSQEALAMGCLVVLFSALLSGFLVAKDDLPAGWEVLARASPIGRGFEALVANEFGPYGAIFRLSTKIGSAIEYSDYLTGDDVLRCFGFDGGRYWSDLGVLAAVGACGLGLALLFLKRSR